MHDLTEISGPSNRASLMCELDSVTYGYIEIQDIPAGCAVVLVLVDDIGKEYCTVMIAGSLGIKCTSSSDSSVGTDGEDGGQTRFNAVVE